MPESETRTEEQRHIAMIEKECDAHGLYGSEYAMDEDEQRISARLGRGLLLEDDEDQGLVAGEEGVVTAMVVGHESHGNERVKFFFRPDGGMDTHLEVDPLTVELI